jgi:hypothetical protein
MEPLSTPFGMPVRSEFGDFWGNPTHRGVIDVEKFFQPQMVTKAAHDAIMVELAAERAKNEELIAQNKRLIENLKSYIDQHTVFQQQTTNNTAQ